MCRCQWRLPYQPLIKISGVLGLACCLIIAPISQSYAAVMPVEDLAAIAQLAASVSQLIKLVSNSTKDLQAFADLAGLAESGVSFATMAADLTQVYSQLDSIRQGWLMLSDPSKLPKTVRALFIWKQQAQMWALLGARGGMQAFTQIMTSVITSLRAMQRIVGTLISRISGSVGGLQSIAGLLEQGLAGTTALSAIVLNGNQALIGPQMIEQVTALAFPSIIQDEMRTWGQP